ncbi:putative Retrotransposon protein [Cucumis melo var. makuwa]|uniref:Retrotransposon protein n=1 Tax=Cucumis melo var. makuwa TaxID=1194695 RepID=A0A5A7V7Y0_CUCMM|nr:putative Retrotransposon protein [Cucumis melo var. makuwa]
MPPRTSRRRRQNQDGTQDPTQGQSESGFSTPRGQNEAGSERFARCSQEIGRLEIVGPRDPKKIYGIDRFKKLGVTVFEGSTNPADIEVWCNNARTLVAEYERKYTKLSRYAEVIVASESDRCRRQSQRASSQSVNSVAKPWTGQESVASESRRTPCVSCGTSHRGQCLVGTGVCYQCGQTGHSKRACP